MDTAISRGVHLHNPSKAISLITDQKTGSITGIKLLNLLTHTESVIPCTKLVICAGPWSPKVFEDLFPSAKISLPIIPLAGYSLLIRSPRHTLAHERDSYQGRSHAVFTTHPRSCGFSPELFSREGGEIYIAGLNDPSMSLPALSKDAANLKVQADKDKLHAVAVRLMGRLAEEEGQKESTDKISNVDDLEVTRESLCFRPVSTRGTPVVSKVKEHLIGDGIKGDVFVASGHGPWGISLSLGTGKVVADMVQGLKPSADVSRLGL